jgi:hypothetical protein
MKSGIYIRVKKQAKDILELTDNQFLSLLNNELDAFEFNGEKISATLRNKVLETYLIYVRKSPLDRDKIRISAILALQDMGRRFVKNKEEWALCLKELNLKETTDSPKK